MSSRLTIYKTDSLGVIYVFRPTRRQRDHIQPDRLVDNFGREPVAAIDDSGNHRWVRRDNTLAIVLGGSLRAVTKVWHLFAVRLFQIVRTFFATIYR